MRKISVEKLIAKYTKNAKYGPAECLLNRENTATKEYLEELVQLREDYAMLNDFERSQCAKLLAQLAEAQAREQAAVEHLTLRNTMERVPCISCKKSCVDSKDYYCRDWVYCGPQEAGKGASRGAK